MRRGAGERGFTLVELLLVMGILGVVLGTGLGALASLNPGERTALSTVKNALRAANNSAIARSGPARVRIDREAGTLVAESQVVVGTWRFEDLNLEGAFGLNGVAVGMDEPPLDDAGYQGHCLDLARAPRTARVLFPVHEDPAFDLSAGFAIEVSVRPSDLAAATLLDIGGVLLVELGPRAELAATFVAAAVTETGERVRGSRISLRTGSGALRLGSWNRLEVRYDRRFLVIAVDGVELARRPESANVWELQRGLTLGGGTAPFPGKVDDLVISAVAASTELTLPDGVQFGRGTPVQVQFAPGGGLDPIHHSGALLVPLEFADGRVETLRIGRYGTIE